MTTDFSFNTDPAGLDLQFNNRLRVPQFAEHFKRWQTDSIAARNSQPCHLDIAYGQGGIAQMLDIFPAAVAEGSKRSAPVMVFIHGGYWRSLDKSDHSFVAPSFTQAGACVVIPNYPLCPAVTMEQIVLSQVQALVWVYRHIAQYGGDPQRISAVGHSAGGHLAAMMLACIWSEVSVDLPAQLVRNALSLSGLHDLAPIMHSPYLQNDVHLTPAQVSRCSPAYFPAPAGQLMALCGDDESDEFKRQNRLIAQTWGSDCVKICETIPHCNHFSVLEALCSPDDYPHELANQLLAA